MLTNLAYAGGGANTYGDVKTLTNGTGSGSATYTIPSYYVVPSTTNYTSEPTDPSTSTNGAGQYGYVYNWCGAMGAQTSTSACTNTTSPIPNVNLSICPSGWRLPTGGSTDEFQALATAIGATNNPAGVANLKTIWLGQLSGSWIYTFGNQGSYGRYWSSTQINGTYVYGLRFESANVYPWYNGGWKSDGIAVRCIAS